MPTAEKWILVGSKHPPRHLSRVKATYQKWHTDGATLSFYVLSFMGLGCHLNIWKEEPKKGESIGNWLFTYYYIQSKGFVK